MSSIFSSFSGKSANSSSASSLKSNKSGAKELRQPPPETSEIFTVPPEGIVPTKKWNYDEGQLKQIEELKTYSATIALSSEDPYYPWEQRFLADPGTHPRYMRAAKWKMDDAKRRIKGTMEFRREFKPELIEPGDVGPEAETGKIILSGFDNDARPILYMRPGRENTETSPRQIRHLIYHLERAIDLMPAGQEQVCIIIDYKSATSQSNPSISTGRKVLGILQNHYVERLGRGLVCNMSWIVNLFFQGIQPLMDPITRDKIRFNPVLTELVPPNQLDFEFGGDYNLKFEHKTYWETITKFCHIAPDGTRIDDEGKKWYPPSGNGIKAAVDGLLPASGAVATGQVTTDPSQAQQNGNGSGNGADTNADENLTSAEAAEQAQNGIKRTASQQIAANHRDSMTLPAAATEGTAGIASGVAALDVGSSKGDGSVSATATETWTGTGNGGLDEPPVLETKSGAPVGDVAFDHPPTEKEKEEIRQSLDLPVRK